VKAICLACGKKVATWTAYDVPRMLVAHKAKGGWCKGSYTEAEDAEDRGRAMGVRK